MALTPHVIHTRAELSEAVPKITLAVDEEEARLAGLDHAGLVPVYDVGPKLLEELVPEGYTVGQVQKVLQGLLSERVSVRDLEAI